MTKATSLSMGDGLPIGYTKNEFVLMCLDDLEPTHGTNASAIVRAAVDALYRRVIQGVATDAGAQYDTLRERFAWNSQQCIEYALFWLWLDASQVALFSQPPSATVSAIDVVVWRCNECGVWWTDGGYTENVYGPDAAGAHVHPARLEQHAPNCGQGTVPKGV